MSRRSVSSVGAPQRKASRGAWTGAIGVALRARLAKRIRTLSNERRWSQQCGEVQRRTLRRLLEQSQHTEIGRELKFADLIRRYDKELVHAYQQATPANDYEVFRLRLSRMRDGGEADVLYPGVIKDWAQTSGTTGGEKFIPVSRAMMRSNTVAAFDIFAHAHRFGVSLRRLFGGKLLFLGGSTNLHVNEHGVRTGDLSGLATNQIRWPISCVYSPGRKVALMDHWPSKIDTMAQISLDQDIRCVSGMASWSLVLFEKVVELARQRDTKVRTLRDVWPNFELFIHGGVKYAPFANRVRQVWSGDEGADIPTRLEVYPASEGFIAVQDRAGDPGLRLQTDVGNFYEFVPLEEIDSPDARSFTCDEVDVGQRYVVVMTTCAGLWRYVIGDVVEFDTAADRSTRPGEGLGPPRLRIVGRHRHFINAFGENLIVEDIERAVVAARDVAQLAIGEFTAAPVYPGETTSAGLELAVEIEPKAQATADQVARFAEVFDRTLRRHNVDYDTKRTDDLGMAPATVTPVPPGSFHRWMAQGGKLGGQHKTPRCANHRDILDAVVSAAATR